MRGKTIFLIALLLMLTAFIWADNLQGEMAVNDTVLANNPSTMPADTVPVDNGAATPWIRIWGVISGIVTIASIVVKITPSPKDDALIKPIYELIHFLSLNKRKKY